MCEHLNFAAEVDVNRLPQKEGGPIEHYQACHYNIRHQNYIPNHGQDYQYISSQKLFHNLVVVRAGRNTGFPLAVSMTS